MSALWRKKSNEIEETDRNEFYKFLTNDFEPPFGHLHLSLEGAAVSFKALLFIPNKAPFDLYRNPEQKTLNLYSNKILIQDDCKELLPEYLRFVRGVVDTIDLPLNVSREVTQSSPVMVKIKNIVTTKLLALFTDWANTEPEKYKTFYAEFGRMIATGIQMDFSNRDKIVELLRFESSFHEKGQLRSFKDYVAQMKENQKEIYYLSGENRADIERNPNLEYFKKNNIEVLLLTDPIDIFTIPAVGEYEKKKVTSIDKADIDLMPEDTIEKPEDDLSKSLVLLFKETLKDKVENVVPSKRLVDSAVTLVTPKNGMDPQMEKMMKMMGGSAGPSSKKIMEVNMEHPAIRNLSRMYIANNADPFIKTCIDQLYDGALMIEGAISSPADFIKRMTDIMIEATK